MAGLRRKVPGFTLIELLIVIALIGVLAAIMLPNYNRSRARAKLSACKQSLRNVATALESYASDHNGLYPESLTELTQGPSPYLAKMPFCEECGEPSSYINGYQYSNEVHTYTVVCKGSYHAVCDLQPDCPGFSPLHGGFDYPIDDNGSDGDTGGSPP